LILTGRSTQKSRRKQGDCLTDNLHILTENPPQSSISFPPDFVLRAQPHPPTPASQYLSQNKTIKCLILVTTLVALQSSGSVLVNREREKFILRQPPIGEKDYYDSENSWFSDGLPSSSRRRRRGDGRGGEGEWREK